VRLSRCDEQGRHGHGGGLLTDEGTVGGGAGGADRVQPSVGGPETVVEDLAGAEIRVVVAVGELGPGGAGGPVEDLVAG